MYQLVAIHFSLIIGCVHGGINLARVFNRVYGKVGIHLYDYRNGGVVARLYPTLIIKPVFADFVTLMSRPILLKTSPCKNEAIRSELPVHLFMRYLLIYSKLTITPIYCIRED